MGVSQHWGSPCQGHPNKNYDIWGSILGSSYYGKYHIEDFNKNKSGHNLKIQKSRVQSFRTPFDGTYVGPTNGMGPEP